MRQRNSSFPLISTRIFSSTTSQPIVQLEILTIDLSTQQGSLILTQDALPNREIRWNISPDESSLNPWTGGASLSATATIPSKVIAWSLDQMALLTWPYRTGDQTFTAISRQPTVTASCTEAHWLNSTTMYSTFRNGSEHYILQSQYLQNLTRSETFNWVFFDHDDLVIQKSSQLNSTVWILAQYPVTSQAMDDLALCAIYAGYAHVQNKILITDETSMSSRLVSSQTNNASVPTIPVPATWLNRTLPTLSTLLDNGLLGVDMATFLATSLAISMAQWPKQILNYPNDFPTLSWPPSLADAGIIIGDPSTNATEFPNPSLRWLSSSPGDHLFFPGTEYADREGKYKLQMNVSSHGYGYSIDQPTKVIAIAVLTAYCLYISIFVILMLTFNRVHSTAWDSIGELTALAIMSRPDDKLKNTSAGIETVALFKLPMNIRANENNHLEILFGDGSETSDSRMKTLRRKTMKTIENSQSELILY
ncbi:hypothetical protein KCU91_g93, partial [Aureobasidium melanogenum]